MFFELQMQLEKVIGMSSRNNNSMAVNPTNGEVASTAGCIICIYNPKENKQTRFLFSRLQRSFSCLTYSNNGKYLAAGEGAFRQPEITIWEISLDNQYTEIKHLKGHKYGIEAILFSPNMNYLLSLGDANDRGLFVWDWESEQRVTSNKLGKPVNTFAFSERGEYFVTAGYQHLKYWYFDEQGKVMKTESGSSKESIMESKTADLTKVIVKIFVGVACYNQLVYSLAQDGNLYVYDKQRVLKKWMNIKVDKAFTLTVSSGNIYCGCSDGFIRVFAADTLSHRVTLPKPPPLGQANIEAGVKKIRIPSSKDSKFADILAVIVDDINKRAIVLYSDKMMFLWDVKDLEKITVLKSNMFHCGPIHDIQFLPNSMEFGFKDENAAVIMQEEQSLTRFITCSSDRTIRFWHFIDPTASSQNQAQINQCIIKNAYCKDMSRMIYVNSENRDHNVGQFDHFKVRVPRINEDGSMIDQQATLSPDDKDIEQQVRCVRISPDGKHVACGDWTGNIRVHDVKSLEEIQCIQAHESEVLCLDYSPIIDLQGSGNNSQQNNASGDVQPQQLQLTSTIKYWLASGSRDRLTQIYELSQESGSYENVTILEDHSSTLTSLKFAEETSTKNQKRLKLISTGADKQIVLRNIDLNIVQQNDVRKLQNMTTEEFMVVQKKQQCKYKSFSMDIAHQAGYIVTGHDRFIQMFSLFSCDNVMEKRIESSRKSGSMDQIRVLVDQNAGVVVSSSTDKYVTVYEAATGSVICRTTCGEITTAMCLSTNMKHMITTSTDGIIYVWRMPENLTKALQILKQEQKRKEAQILEEIDRGVSIATDINNQQLQGIQAPNNNQVSAGVASNLIGGGGADDDFNELENIATLSSAPKWETVKKQVVVPGVDSSSRKNEPVRVSEVLAQISKATGQIDKIQLKQNVNQIMEEREEEEENKGSSNNLEDKKKKKSKDNRNNFNEEDEEEFDFGLGDKASQPQKLQNQIESNNGSNSLESSQNNQKRNRVNWGNKQKSAKPNNNNDSGETSPDQSDEQHRQMRVKENKLPRWAQSVTGDLLSDEMQQRNTLVAQRASKQSVDGNKQALNEVEEDIEDVFQSTLDKANSSNADETALIEKQTNKDTNNKTAIASVNGAIGGVGQLSNVGANQGAIPRNAFYDRIEEDLDEDKKSNDESKSQVDLDEDEEEKQIKEQLQRRQMQKSRIMLGIEDEEDMQSQDASTRRLRLRNNESRTSLSQQFFQRKLGASSEQNLFRGQALNEIQMIQNQFNNNNNNNSNNNQQQQPTQGKREMLRVEDLFGDEDDSSNNKQGSEKQITNGVSGSSTQSKGLQQSQSQFISQTPQLITQAKKQIVKPYNQTITSHEPKQRIDIDLDAENSEQPQQSSELRRLAQEKYEQHKKLLEEEYKKKQKDMEDKVRKEKEAIDSQHQLRKSQIELLEKEKLNQMDQIDKGQNSRPKIQILEEIESEIKREDDRLAALSTKQQVTLGQGAGLTSSHLKIGGEEKKKQGTSNKGSRSRSPRYPVQQQENIDESIQEDESIVQIRQAPGGSKASGLNAQARTVEEAAINATVKAEIDKINNSLAKITQSLNSTGQGVSSLNNALRMKDDVTESLSRSMGLWNSMMLTLSNRTSINVNLLQSSQMSSFSQSQSQIYGGGAVNNSSAVNQSFLSQVSVKDDARDLLQKYSELLIEEIAKKLNKK